ncbi:MAG TPA: Gfo/Idh/MocA family oxidoreductase [Trebonia sp.]|jgi:predicted dehydrogenase
MTGSPASGPVPVGIIGAGNVSDQYLRTLAGYPDIEVRGIADLHVERARKQASAHGIGFAGSADELLAADDIELVLNLTIPAAHADVARAAIESGRHVWGEKPLALDRASGAAVLKAAAANGVAVGSAPDTILGPGIQAAQRLIEDGAIGAPATVLTLMQGPGPEAWHPRPQFLFSRGAGPLFDIGPYYVTTLVQLLGPVAEVRAAGHRLTPERTIGTGPDAGTRFPVDVDTHVSVLTTFRSGVVGTSIYSFDSPVRRQRFEITGEAGTLRVPVSGFNDPPALLAATGPERGWTDIGLPGETRDRGVGVLEMARAIRGGHAPRASGQLAYHALDVMLAIEESAATGRPVAVESDAPAVPPLPQGWTAAARTLPAAGTGR